MAAWAFDARYPEYQKVLEASLAEQAKGNQDNWLSLRTRKNVAMRSAMKLDKIKIRVSAKIVQMSELEGKMTEIDKHPKSGIDKEDDTDVNRRGFIGKALLILGATTASTVAAGTAIAKTADVSIDSLGRPMIEGKPVEGEQLAAVTRPATTNNCRCTNVRCVRPQRAQA